MGIKLLGAILIIAGCGGVGFKIAAMYLREEKNLRELIGVLDFMECELQYHKTPLPDLCRQAGAECKGILKNVLQQLSEELEEQIAPDVSSCMQVVLAKLKNPPEITCKMLDLLGRNLGKFDMDGQLKGLESVRGECRRTMERLQTNKEVRVRSYQTLGLCAGAALAILFV